MGEGVFIGPESSERLAKVAYVRYLSTAVQRLSRTSRYYPEGIPKSSVRPVLFGVHLLYYSQSTIVLSVSGRPMGDHCTSTNPSVRPVQKSNFPKCLLVDPSDPKSKLTL
jgi:hypothetical protein